MRLKISTVDGLIGNIGELIRFVFTGGIATLCNMAVVWLCRARLPASLSIVCGLIAGLGVSFLMMKLYAFKASGWAGAKGEMVRFLLVYAFGTCAYLLAALITERLLSDAAAVPARVAAIGGVFVGGLLMAGTSYFGHRNFTYRGSQTGQQR